MFLSLTWAFISDVDINSESLRCLGPARFEVYGVYRALNVRHYGAKISFRGAKVLTNRREDLPELDHYGNNVIDDRYTYCNIMNLSHAAFGHKFAPMAELDDGAVDI